MNKRGGLMDMPMNLMLLFMSVVFLVALIPAFSSIINMAQQSDSLNCAGYVYSGDAGSVLSYNSSLSTNSIACFAIKLYLPYIVLGVLITGVALILYGRNSGGGQVPQQEYYG